MLVLSGLAFAGLLIAAAIIDIREFRIPNIITGALALLFSITCTFGFYRPLTPHLMAFGITAVLGATLFFTQVWGGGDTKLLAAIGLYLEPRDLLPFFLITALAGGVFAVAALARRQYAGGGRELQDRIPYGVALAAGGIACGLKGILP